MWQVVKPKLLEIYHKSWTTFLGQLKIVGGLVLAIGSYAGHIYNDPGVHAAIDKMPISTEVGLGLAVLGALVLLSEKHD